MNGQLKFKPELYPPFQGNLEIMLKYRGFQGLLITTLLPMKHGASMNRTEPGFVPQTLHSTLSFKALVCEPR
jgi:hypothetical protein